jgi:Kef-type K+ transport system membrane component KefB
MSSDLSYVVLLFVLFVIPRFLQRYRLPAAITSLLLGIGAAEFGLFDHDATLALLSTLGITTLFLFAGLEVDLDDLRPDARVLAQHLAIWLMTLIASTTAGILIFNLSWRPATLLALAIVTPSTGFILDSLDRFGLSDAEKRWTKAKAISSELVALGLMFIALRSGSIQELGLSLLALVLLIVLLPPLFRWFAAAISPYAPRSEFAFLIMVALISSSITRHLGVYYLVGAFVSGLAARQFRDRLPAMSSERMLGAVEAFASVFIPFYFFKAGQQIRLADLGGLAIAAGLVITLVFVSLRLGEVALHRWIVLKEPPEKGANVGIALLPTLVFSLVCAQLLRDNFIVPGYLVGGVVIYTILNTMLPGFVLKVPPPNFETPHLDPPPPTGEEGEANGTMEVLTSR